MVYAIVAWAVIESTSVIFPALQMPEWTVTFVVVLALIGFPVTLIFSWVFDWTRGGLVRTPERSELPKDQAVARHRGRVIDFIIIAVLLAVIGWLGWERIFDRADAPGGPTLDSIAVLPFVNLTGDPADEYFGDGLAEELLNALVQVEGLRVAARTSSFQYKGQALDIRRIAEDLGVSSVLEGSVRRANGRVRVTAQLIRAEDGFHLWSESYDRRLEDIFALQDDITLAIVDALRVRLGARERERVTARHTEDVQAFEAYLRGRFEMHKRSPSSLRRAMEEFRAAIGRDPDYAAAYSGSSDTWLLLAEYAGVAQDEAMRNAEPMARRALELDPQLAEAHASWGLVLRSKGDVAGSIEPLRRATELNPSYSPAWHWLSLSLSDAGRFREAGEALRNVLEVDPGYLTGKRVFLGTLRMIGEHDEADAYARELERDHGDDALVLYGLSADAVSRGDFTRAARLIVRAIRMQPEAVHLRQSLASLLIAVGDLERADEQMEIAAMHAPDSMIIRLWPVQRALLADDRETREQALDEFVSSVPESLDREMLICNFAVEINIYERALVHCRKALEMLGWTSGEPLPAGGGFAGAILVLAGSMLGNDDVYTEFEPLVEREFERMREAGLDPEQVEQLNAIFALHRGEPESLLELLPEWIIGGRFNLVMLESSPIYEPVRDDPRFQAELERVRAYIAEQRRRIDEIEMPGP